MVLNWGWKRVYYFSDGFVLSNHHVVAGADKVIVTMADREFYADIIGSDQRTDVAC